MANKNYVNVSGTWREVKKKYINVSGTWREIKKEYVNVGGAWRLEHNPVVEYTFTGSITASVSTGIPLSSYINPASADVFNLVINDGVVLSGSAGGNGGNGVAGNYGIYVAPVNNCSSGNRGNGGNGGAGGAGGYGMNFSGFSGKTINIINSGTLKGGNGGNGGNGGALALNIGCEDTVYSGCGGAGGAGGLWYYGNSGVTFTYAGNSPYNGSAGGAGVRPTPTTYSSASCSCFIKGQLVLMADSTYKKIEDVRVGDKVQGAYGASDINTVTHLQRPPRGNRVIFNINNLLVSDEHGILNGDRDGFLYLNMEHHYAEADMVQACLDKDFNEVGVYFQGLNAEVTLKEDLVIGSKIATTKGHEEIKEIISTDIQDEILYHLVLDGGSRTYAVSDVFVSGYADDTKYDYKKGEIK